jgi:NADH:ubiquinone oxidoreductase subunit E
LRDSSIDAAIATPYFSRGSEGNIPMSLEFSADAQKKIAAACERYPSAATKQPVVMLALHLAQKEHGHLSDDALRLVARTLDLPYAHVYGVATFYTMYRREPGGRQTIRMCTNISCMLRDGYAVLEAFEARLGIKRGESNAEFNLVEEECIAACANAPCAVVGTEYLLDITPDQVGDIIERLQARPHPESEVL